MEGDEAAMHLQLLLTGPKNEQNLDECLEVPVLLPVPVPVVYYSPQLGDQFDSLNENDDDEAAVDELEIEDYIEPSMLGCFLPSSSLGHGRRGPRRSSSSEREPSTSGGRKHRGRKNNPHWTEDEVRQLVKGVASHRVGKWSHVKRNYFQESIRTTAHLKDKWKNLVKACNKKENNGGMLLHLEQSLIEQIKEINADHPYPKQSNNDEDHLAPIFANHCLVSSTSPLAQQSTMKTRTKKGVQ